MKKDTPDHFERFKRAKENLKKAQAEYEKERVEFEKQLARAGLSLDDTVEKTESVKVKEAADKLLDKLKKDMGKDDLDVGPTIYPMPTYIVPYKGRYQWHDSPYPYSMTSSNYSYTGDPNPVVC